MKINIFKIILITLMLGLFGCNNENDKQQESLQEQRVSQVKLPSIPVAKKIIANLQAKVDASDMESIKSADIALLFAYYTAQNNTNDGELRWYISATSGTLAGYIFSLGEIEEVNGVEKVSWREVSTNAATVNVIEEKVIVGNISDNLSYDFLDWGLGIMKHNSSIQEDIELIRNSTVDVRWWFFQAPNSSWYIIDKVNHIYKFETKDGVYDWQGLDTSDENMEFYIENGKKKFRVVPENQIPIVNAGEDKTTALNQAVTITGNAIDNDGSIVSYAWKRGNILLANTASFDYTPSSNGLPTVGTRVDTLILTVTDNDGATASDLMNVTISDEVVPTPLLTDVAVDVALNSISIALGGDIFEVRTDGVAPTSTGKSSVVLWGKSSSSDEIRTLEVHDAYPVGTQFQVVLKNANDEIIGKSELLYFGAGVIDIGFGTIDIE